MLLSNLIEVEVEVSFRCILCRFVALRFYFVLNFSATHFCNLHLVRTIASNLIDIPWLKIGRHFNVHDSKAVHNKLFTNVMIKKCDGSESVWFSDARIKFETGWSVFLSLFWHESLFNLLDKIVNEVKSTEDDLYEILTNFIQKGTFRAGGEYL